MRFDVSSVAVRKERVRGISFRLLVYATSQFKDQMITDVMIQSIPMTARVHRSHSTIFNVRFNTHNIVNEGMRRI